MSAEMKSKRHPHHVFDPADEAVTLTLTKRETQIVELLVSGLEYKEIAENLGIATVTVKTQTLNACMRNGCTRLRLCVKYALAQSR